MTPGLEADSSPEDLADFGRLRPPNRRLLVLVWVAGCGGASPPAPIGSRVGPALTAAFAAADQARAPWRCAAPDGPRLADETLKLGDRTWKLAGNRVKLEGAGATTIGVIADAGGAAAPTVAALGRLRVQLAEADLVIALGGMGSSQAELEATLGSLASPRGLLVAVPGDLESVPVQTATIAALRARGHAVIDGRLARWIELPGATIATLPGARTAVRLVGGPDGCGYRATDVAALFGELTPRAGLRILASAESPRVTIAGEPAGELALTTGAAQVIDVVLHGPIAETASPARSGSRDGSSAALTPGTSDATTRLPGPRHASSAALFTVNGNAWRWKPLVDSK